jgi:hypothetical protein
MSHLVSGLQVPHEQPALMHRADGQPLAVGGDRQRLNLALLAKREQGVAPGLLPKVTPFPAAQIAAAGLRPLAVQQIQRAAQIALGERLLGDIHVRGVGALARDEFLTFRGLAHIGFVALRRPNVNVRPNQRPQAQGDRQQRDG